MINFEGFISGVKCRRLTNLRDKILVLNVKEQCKTQERSKGKMYLTQKKLLKWCLFFDRIEKVKYFGFFYSAKKQTPP